MYRWCLIVGFLFVSCTEASDKGSFGWYDTGNDAIRDIPEDAPIGCQMMGNWFLECGDETIFIENMVNECIDEIDRISQNCSTEAATSYSQGLEAAYSCYLEQGYCAVLEGTTDQTTVDEQMAILESCGALFDAKVESFSQCIYSEEDTGSTPIPSSIEPEEIPFETYQENDIETYSLSLDDDSFAVLEIPFTLPFFDETYNKITITSNALILMGEQNADGCCFAESIPTLDQYNGLIAMGWSDLVPTEDNNIYWWIDGQEPNRELWIRYVDVPSYIGMEHHVSTRLRYKEGTGFYDIFIDSIVSEEVITIGLESLDGSYAVVREEHNAKPLNVEQIAFRYRVNVP